MFSVFSFDKNVTKNVVIYKLPFPLKHQLLVNLPSAQMRKIYLNCVLFFLFFFFSIIATLEVISYHPHPVKQFILCRFSYVVFAVVKGTESDHCILVDSKYNGGVTSYFSLPLGLAADSFVRLLTLPFEDK